MLMDGINRQWNSRRNRDRGGLWNGGDRRGGLKKQGFYKRRAGFTIGGNKRCRSRTGGVDDDGVVFLLVGATQDWLNNMLRHVRLGQLWRE